MQTGESDTDDIVFHFNPRWDDGPSIVLNTRQDGIWGNEIALPTVPFQIGRPFHLIIFCQDDGYALTLDDQLLAVYPHRKNAASVKYVTFMGHLNVLRYTFKSP